MERWFLLLLFNGLVIVGKDMRERERYWLII